MDCMTMFANNGGEMQRYTELVAGLIARPGAFEKACESERVVQVERGVVFPWAMADVGEARGHVTECVGRGIELAEEALEGVLVVDRAGHQRAIYRGILVYAWLRAWELLRDRLPGDEAERWRVGMRPWCQVLENSLRGMDWPAGDMPAARGMAAGEACWDAMALYAGGRFFVGRNGGGGRRVFSAGCGADSSGAGRF